jgi:hypothetical protein
MISLGISLWLIAILVGSFWAVIFLFGGSKHWKFLLKLMAIWIPLATLMLILDARGITLPEIRLISLPDVDKYSSVMKLLFDTIPNLVIILVAFMVGRFIKMRKDKQKKLQKMV